jgi:hypothetical protein
MSVESELLVEFWLVEGVDGEDGLEGGVFGGFCDELLLGCCPSRKMAPTEETLNMSKKTTAAKILTFDFARILGGISKLVILRFIELKQSFLLGA